MMFLQKTSKLVDGIYLVLSLLRKAQLEKENSVVRFFMKYC